MVRGGELMVIIRAQDYASRTIHKVTGELAGMQRMQRLQARAQKQYLPQLRQQATLLRDAAMAENAYRTGQAKSTAQTYRTTRAGRVLRKEMVLAQKALAAFQATMTAPTALRGLDATGVVRLGQAIKKLDLEHLHRVGSAMSGIGRSMQLFGAVGTLVFGLTANAAAKFSASAATAGTQMRDLGGSVKQAVDRSKELQKAIIDMSMIFPNSAQDMTDAAYDIFSSMNLMHKGVMNVNAGLRLLAVANKAAVAGGVDLKEATNAMVVALNIFDPKLQDVKGTMDEVFDIVRFGRIRLDDLSHVFTQFASAAKAGGMSLKDVGAAFATLTLFQDPGKASAGLGRLIELLRVPEFRQGLDKMIGVDVIDKASGKFRPLLTIFQEIVKARPDLAASRQAAIDFFIQLTKASGLTKKGVQGTVQARRAFEVFATHMGTFADTVANVGNNYDEMNKAFKARMTDPGVQWELLKNRLRALAIVIGQQVLPVFLQIGRWIAGAVRWFKGMNDGVKGTFLRFAAWAAVGTLLAGVLLSLGGSIIQLTATLGLLRLASIAAGESFVFMRTALIASGIGAIVVAFGVAAVLVIKNWSAVRAFFVVFSQELTTNWGDTMQKMAGLTLKGVAAILNPLYQLEKRIPYAGKFAKFLGPLNMVSAGLEEGGDKLMDSSDAFTHFWTRFHNEIAKSAKQGNKGTDWLKDFKRIAGNFDGKMLSKGYQDWAKSVGDSTGTASQLAKDHAQAVKEATDNMQQTIKTATTNLINMYQQMQQANQTALGGLFQGPTMSGILGNVFSNINDNLRQFGVQIPIPFNILKQDLDQSIKYFTEWRGHLAQLAKRGVPFEMLQELQAAGPEKDYILQGLLQAPKGTFRGLIKSYKTTQRLTDKATKEDMARKLRFYESFGKDAAWATIMGIIDNPRNLKIQKLYENYVKNTYGAILKKAFQDDVATYMTNAIAIAKAQAAQANIGAAFPKNIFAPGTGTGGGRAAPQTIVTPQQVRATRNLMLSRKNAAAALGMWSVDPRSHLGTTISGKEDRATLALQQQQMAAQRKLARQRRALAAERQSIMGQLRAQGAGGTKGAAGGMYNISYGGETITIHADGATPAAVDRAIKKLAFAKKHRHKKGTTVKNP